MNIGRIIRFCGAVFFISLMVMNVGMWAADSLWPGTREAYSELDHRIFGMWLPELFEATVTPVAPVLKSALLVFIYPVGFVENQMIYHAGLDIPTQHPAKMFFGMQLFVLSWVFWFTAGSRGLKAVGLWDPFWTARGRQRGLILRAWIRMRDWWEMMRRFGKEPTARWASLVEVISHRFCEGDIFLGRPKLPIGGMLRPVGIKTEKHMVTIAGTGSGKSTAGLVPNLCLHEGSLLCIDPKGELAALTASRRGIGVGKGRGLDQAVSIVDPYGLVTGKTQAGSSYNPFDEMKLVSAEDPDRAVGYAAKIAEALVRPMSDKESYWDNAAKTFIRGLVLYIFAHEKKKNLLRLRELVMQGDVEGHAEAVKAGIIKRDELNSFDYLLEKMKQGGKPEYDGAIAASAQSIAMMGEGQRGSVITTAQEHTAFLDVPEIRRVSERSDFFLEDLVHYMPRSIYLVLPIHSLKGAEGRWLRMFVLLFIDMMMRAKQPPEKPVLLAIDEFPSLGRLDGIEIVAPVMRSYGVRFWAVAQDIGQLAAVYPDTWTGFIGGAEAVQFMGVNHPATVDFIVERLGQGEVTRGSGQGRWREVRPLLDRDQVSRFLAKEHKNQIVWFGSRHPMMLKLCPYYEYMPWWYYARDKRFRESLNRRVWRWMLDWSVV